jgi:hypothetical protein
MDGIHLVRETWIGLLSDGDDHDTKSLRASLRRRHERELAATRDDPQHLHG